MADQQVQLKLNAASDRYIALGVDDGTTEDTYNRFELQADGQMDFGSGSATPDTNLYRSAADTLKTDDTFNAGGGLQIGGSAVYAPAIVNTTASSLTLTRAAHSYPRKVTVNAAAGCALTLPAATGSGDEYVIILGTTVTSNSTTIKVVGDDTMVGFAHVAQDGGDTSVLFGASGTDDTITLNGTTTGGTAGDKIILIDEKADRWHVHAILTGTGTEATPFSATVT